MWRACMSVEECEIIMAEKEMHQRCICFSGSRSGCREGIIYFWSFFYIFLKNNMKIATDVYLYSTSTFLEDLKHFTINSTIHIQKTAKLTLAASINHQE